MEWDLEDLKQSIIQSSIDHEKIMDDTFIESLKSEGQGLLLETPELQIRFLILLFLKYHL